MLRYRNVAKIPGNINICSNIIGVKPIHPKLKAKTLGCVNNTTEVLGRGPKFDR